MRTGRPVFDLGTLVRVVLCEAVRWGDLGEGQGPWDGSREAMVAEQRSNGGSQECHGGQSPWEFYSEFVAGERCGLSYV